MADEGGKFGILPGEIERCCASSFPPEASKEDARQARNLYFTVRSVNCEREGGPRLGEIVYRNSSREADTRYHVFRFDLRSYPEIFERGFEASPQGATPEETYYNLDDHVNNAGVSQTPHGFVSTTLSSCLATGYKDPVGTRVYRYEIYAPGGILVGLTLGNRCNFLGQGDVAFVRGIAPQYILSVQIFRIIDHDSKGFAVLQRDDLDRPYRVLNTNFRLPPSKEGNPQRIVNPACTYLNSQNRKAPLRLVHYLGERLAPPEDSGSWERYICDLTNYESNVDAAFRTSNGNEAYIFLRNECVLLNYAPGTKDDFLVKGPLLIRDGFPSLADTPFGEYGIHCAFKIQDKNEAFIFFDNLCSRLNFAPDDKITKGPSTIASMFPSLKDTEFERGVDAAFESFLDQEAYLFRGSQYARIDYSDSAPKLIAPGLISEGFPSLGNTIFKDGIDAAFASHGYNEAYIFKQGSYARINYGRDTRNARIIDRVKEISPNWPSLRNILPRKNYGLDVHNHRHSEPAESGGGHVHDVL